MTEFREESPPETFVAALSARIEADALPAQSVEVVEAYRRGFATVAGVHDPDAGTLAVEVQVVTVDGLVCIGKFDGELLGFQQIGGVWGWCW